MTKNCERCGASFEPNRKRDWFCHECVGALLNEVRQRQGECDEEQVSPQLAALIKAGMA